MAQIKHKQPHGQIRASQLITTYGPGALIELPNYSGIICGLESWYFGDNSQTVKTGKSSVGNGKRENIIYENRLTRKLKELLKKEYLLLKSPPIDEQNSHRHTGITVKRFPRWFMSQIINTEKFKGARARLLVPEKAIGKSNYFIDEDKVRTPVMPVPYVRACKLGHIGDIDWRYLCHQDFKSDCTRNLWLVERGTSSDISDQTVRCECGKQTPLSVALDQNNKALGFCDGYSPWLGTKDENGCKQINKFLVRTASNTYFPQQMRIISLPEEKQVIQSQIDPVWHYIENVENMNELDYEYKREEVKQALKDFSREEVFEYIQNRRNAAQIKAPSVKEAEFELLTSIDDKKGEDNPSAYFLAEKLAKIITLPNITAANVINKVVLVHRLREVIALIGFTRFEPASVNIDGDLEMGVERAPLSNEANWVPAIENKGEGVFIEFNKQAIDKWLKINGVVERSGVLNVAFEKWHEKQHGSKRRFPDAAYIMLHSLSHLLLTTIALECGYPTTSLRERIYASADKGYGILLYTGTTGSEGTLGGLIDVGRNIDKHIAQALELGRLCSNDPICAQHNPENTLEERYFHGAACHGCLLISETSCEMQNEFLDRALVIPTIDTQAAAFFAG